MNELVTIIAIVYSVWAIYSGWKFVTNRIPALNVNKPLVIAVKIVLSVVIGYVVGAVMIAVAIFGLIALRSLIVGRRR